MHACSSGKGTSGKSVWYVFVPCNITESLAGKKLPEYTTSCSTAENLYVEEDHAQFFSTHFRTSTNCECHYKEKSRLLFLISGSKVTKLSRIFDVGRFDYFLIISLSHFSHSFS